MPISVIVAMGQNQVIGDDRGLPWRLPRDLRRFRQITWGKPIIMGRKTFELIGRPLPGRDNIVLTHKRSFAAPGVHIVHDAETAVETAQRLAGAQGEIFIMGGSEVYRQFLGRAERIYLTVVEGNFTGSARFPFAELARMDWELVADERFPADADNPHGQRFVILERVREGQTAAQPIEPARLLAG